MAINRLIELLETYESSDNENYVGTLRAEGLMV